MKRLILIFCLLFSLPAHGVKFERAGGNYFSTNGELVAPVRCLKLRNSFLYSRAKREYRVFKKLYKRKTLKKYLKRVVFCSELWLGPVREARGTYNVKNNTVFIEVNYKSNDTLYLLNHEFSSILLLKHKELKEFKKEWVSNNVGNYKPLFDERYGDNQWRLTHAELRMRGFLYPYSRTDFENDFNVMAAYYKSDYLRSRLLKAARNYSRIKNKFNLLKKFYKKL